MVSYYNSLYSYHIQALECNVTIVATIHKACQIVTINHLSSRISLFKPSLCNYFFHKTSSDYCIVHTFVPSFDSPTIDL